MPFQDAFDPSIIVFAALAVFVVWKLHSILGVKVDRETSAPSRFSGWGASLGQGAGVAAKPNGARGATPAAKDRWVGVAEPGSAAAGLDAIAAADSGFSAESFMQGARRAYEMIIEAFAKGDRETLRRLLSDEVYANFLREIEAREGNGEQLRSEVVSIDRASIPAATLNGRQMSVTVRFESRLISVRRDKDGAELPGSHEYAAAVEDLWTFARDAGANDPNWRLVATQTVH